MEKIPILTNIFQMGWLNHQLDKLTYQPYMHQLKLKHTMMDETIESLEFLVLVSDPECPFGIWVFPKIGGKPPTGWFIRENPIKMGWFGGKTPYFRKHPYLRRWFKFLLCFQLFASGNLGMSKIRRFNMDSTRISTPVKTHQDRLCKIRQNWFPKGNASTPSINFQGWAAPLGFQPALKQWVLI